MHFLQTKAQFDRTKNIFFANQFFRRCRSFQGRTGLKNLPWHFQLDRPHSNDNLKKTTTYNCHFQCFASKHPSTIYFFLKVKLFAMNVWWTEQISSIRSFSQKVMLSIKREWRFFRKTVTLLGYPFREKIPLKQTYIRFGRKNILHLSFQKISRSHTDKLALREEVFLKLTLLQIARETFNTLSLTFRKKVALMLTQRPRTVIANLILLNDYRRTFGRIAYTLKIFLWKKVTCQVTFAGFGC